MVRQSAAKVGARDTAIQAAGSKRQASMASAPS
jgi:hypothetical protein